MSQSPIVLPSRQQGFRHISSPYGILIVPSAAKGTWTIAERPFRSLIVNDQGQVVSSGWPKFGNFGEHGFEDADETLRNAVHQQGDVWLTDKLDGSLVVRSVIEGKVVWRTRGSWRLGMFEQPIMALVEQLPLLQDPTWQSNVSLLFEFTSSDPALRVVLTHTQDGLTLLGGVKHSDLSLFDREQLQAVAEQSGLTLVESVNLAGTYKDWKKEIKRWAGREGVVARSGGYMVKFKSDAYVTLHRLKTQFNLRAVKRMIITENLVSRQQFEDHLTKLGADWEILSDVRPMIEAAVDARQKAAQMLPELEAEVDMLCINNVGKKALQLQTINAWPHAKRQAGLLLLDGRDRQAASALSAIMLEEALDPFQDEADL